MRRKIWCDGWKRKYFGLGGGSEQGLTVGGWVENQEAAKRTATDPSVLTSPSGLLVSSCTLLSLPRSHGPGGVGRFSHGDVTLELLVLTTFFFPKLCWWIVYLGQQELARFFSWLIHPYDVQHCDAPPASWLWLCFVGELKKFRKSMLSS
jgi:hypothetical protein